MNPLRQQIRSMLRVENREAGFHAVLKVDRSLSVLDDHFPNHPILPGICMIQAVLLAAARRQGVDELHVRSMRNAKLMLPVRPGDEMVIDAQMTPAPDGTVAIKAKLTLAEKRCAEFSLVAGEGAIR